jgi:nucleotide-binding universal stress UspA family protein
MYKHILVPVDGSPTSHHGLAEAIRLAKLSGGRLRLIHVIDELSFSFGMDGYTSCGAGEWLGLIREGAVATLRAAKAQAEAEGIHVDTVLHDSLSGIVHEIVTAEALKWPAHVIVMGTHGRRGVGRLLLGSGAENILRYAPVPVLLVRSPDHVQAVHEAAVLAASEHAAAHAQHMHVPSGHVAME